MQGYTPLHGCAFQGRAAVCELLMKRGIKHEAHEDGFFPLHRAAWQATKQGHLDTIRVFLENGVDVNLKAGGDGPTLWHHALRDDNDELKELLREFGAEEDTDTFEAQKRAAMRKAMEENPELLKDAIRRNGVTNDEL
jgi:ankyrin repeat protein